MVEKQPAKAKKDGQFKELVRQNKVEKPVYPTKTGKKPVLKKKTSAKR
jgi:hypothetical protein